LTQTRCYPVERGSVFSGNFSFILKLFHSPDWWL